MNRLAVMFIRFYQMTLAHILSGQCRFYPTCSEYGIQSFQQYGFFKALFKSIYRILRCNPFNQGYYDPVEPEKCCIKK